MRGCRLCLSLLNCRGSSRSNEAGHRSSYSETFQDIASAHAFIFSHDVLPRACVARVKSLAMSAHHSKDIDRNPSLDHLAGTGGSSGQTELPKSGRALQAPLVFPLKR
jgi:hypothetical protein